MISSTGNEFGSFKNNTSNTGAEFQSFKGNEEFQQSIRVPETRCRSISLGVSKVGGSKFSSMPETRCSTMSLGVSEFPLSKEREEYLKLLPSLKKKGGSL